jgi:hypothetical protein
VGGEAVAGFGYVEVDEGYFYEGMSGDIWMMVDL